MNNDVYERRRQTLLNYRKQGRNWPRKRVDQFKLMQLEQQLAELRTSAEQSKRRLEDLQSGRYDAQLLAQIDAEEGWSPEDDVASDLHRIVDGVVGPRQTAPPVAAGQPAAQPTGDSELEAAMEAGPGSEAFRSYAKKRKRSGSTHG